MTRAYTERPVWTWKCDECGFETGDLARQSYGLPSAEVMRQWGWFIAETFGDLCPLCNEQTKGWACANWLNTTDPTVAKADGSGASS